MTKWETRTIELHDGERAINNLRVKLRVGDGWEFTVRADARSVVRFLT